MTKKTSVQLLKDVGVGGSAALVEWSGFVLLIGVAHLQYLTAVTVRSIAATAVNYALSARFVFVRDRHPEHREVIWSAPLAWRSTCCSCHSSQDTA